MRVKKEVEKDDEAEDEEEEEEEEEDSSHEENGPQVGVAKLNTSEKYTTLLCWNELKNMFCDYEHTCLVLNLKVIISWNYGNFKMNKKYTFWIVCKHALYQI